MSYRSGDVFELTLRTTMNTLDMIFGGTELYEIPLDFIKIDGADGMEFSDSIVLNSIDLLNSCGY